MSKQYIWVCRLEDGEEAISYWFYTDEADAYIKACDSLLDSFVDGILDMSEVDQATFAKKINDLVSNSCFKEAVENWNCSSLNHDRYYSIYEEVLWDSEKNPITLDDDFFEAIYQAPDSQPPAPPAPATKPFVATTPGATCRGPSCGNYSEYAFADRADGTYVCRSCQMMKQVFGGKP